MFVKNGWYVGAWSVEVTDKPIQRWICGEPIVFFRSKGEAAALADACAHRQYALSKGRVVNDAIRCGYHGFEYGADGICTHVPGQDRIPERAKVHRYPTVEKDGWVWIWPGDAGKAAGTQPPDTPWLVDPGWDGVRFTRRYKCRASLLQDNLLDLSHEAFIHEASIGDDSVYKNGITVEVSDRSVTVDRFMPSCHPSQLYVTTMGVKPPMDRWHTTEFHLPGLQVIHCGVTDPGSGRDTGFHLEVINAITPEHDGSTWYFFAHQRDFAVGDQATNELLMKEVAQVLEEDGDALEAQEMMISSRTHESHDVLIAQDAGVAKARRLMQQMLAAESAG